MDNLNFHDMFPPEPGKETVTEDMHPEKEWFAQAKKIRTTEELSAFVGHMLDDYNHDYGTMCHAIGACALAAAWMGSSVEGITGFQAGFVMWDFIRNWTKTHNKCGLRLVDYDDFLYPQYADKFDKTINEDNWRCIQEEAKINLEDRCGACDEVVRHWQSIVDGKVPFGYKVIP